MKFTGVQGIYVETHCGILAKKTLSFHRFIQYCRSVLYTRATAILDGDMESGQFEDFFILKLHIP